MTVEELSDMVRCIESGLVAAGMSAERAHTHIASHPSPGETLCLALSRKRPRRFFEKLEQDGALSAFMPELAALRGVAQPPVYHPEGDAFAHTMMVLDQAAARTDSVGVRFAALVHDLGKALTPKEEWPKHIGHGERGVAPIGAVCDRMGVAAGMRTLAQQVSAYHIGVHQMVDPVNGHIVSKAGTFRRLFAQLGLFAMADTHRAGRHLADFATVCACDARGRLGKASAAYPQEHVLLETWRSAAAVTLTPAEATKPSGPQVLTGKRVDAIKQCLRVLSSGNKVSGTTEIRGGGHTPQP